MTFHLSLESDNEVRVVKSQKDRTFENINDIVAKFRNAKKNGDWPLIQEVFSNANKQIEKSKMLIAQHGMPPSYIKMLAELEDTVLLALKDKDAVKKMKPVVSKALNQMKLQIKKHNENYKTEIADFRANPEKYEETVEESESSSSESDSDSSDSDSDSDSDSSDSDSDSDSSKSSTPAKKAPAAAAKKAKVAFFVPVVLSVFVVWVFCDDHYSSFPKASLVDATMRQTVRFTKVFAEQTLSATYLVCVDLLGVCC